VRPIFLLPVPKSNVICAEIKRHLRRNQTSSAPKSNSAHAANQTCRRPTPFRFRWQTKLKTTAVVLENHRSRFGKPPQSFPKKTPFVFALVEERNKKSVRHFGGNAARRRIFELGLFQVILSPKDNNAERKEK